jgi:hypothetical protein
VGERDLCGVLLEGFDVPFWVVPAVHYPTVSRHVHDRAY